MSSDDMFFEYDGEYIDMALDPKIKAVGFDMDGTFMHTKVDYVKLARVVYDEFESLGVPDEILQTDNYKLTMDGGIRQETTTPRRRPSPTRWQWIIWRRHWV